jgi:transposase InsO family protein
MQMFNLHPKIHNLYRSILPEKSRTEYEKLCEKIVTKWETCHKNNMKPKDIQKLLGISRATYYRKKKFLEIGIIRSKRPKTVRVSGFTKDIHELILKIRRENPTYGKAKIAVILRRDHSVNISESSVGRILKKLNVPKSMAAPRYKKRRKFNKHAKPWEYKDYNDMVMGERVQIDHMTVTKNGVTIKHFGAWERISKHIHANCYGNAKSSTAKKFLEELVGKAPYKILSLQVDGGSEFMKEFEEACEELNIPLIVLPPASPKYNGGVERSNGIFRTEFYNNPRLLEDSIQGIRRELLKTVDKYNNFRPHNNLHGRTPMEYISTVLEANYLSQNL